MAERHFVNGGGALTWGLTANWSLTEGGAGGQSVPVITEDVFFDAGSPSCTIATSDRACLTLTASAYTNTLTFTNNLSVSGNVNIGSGVKWSGAARLRMVATGTLTTNGNAIGVPLQIGQAATASGTYTLAGTLNAATGLYLNHGTSTTFAGDYHITASACTISGTQTITIIHGVTISGLTTISDANVIDGVFNWETGGLTTTGSLTGTTPIVLTGGTWTGAAGTLSKNLTFAGDVTLSGTLLYSASATPTITYASGTITQGTSVLSLATNCTFDTNGMSWYDITITGTGKTFTINSLLTATGTLTLPGQATTFAGTAGFTVGTLTHSDIALTRVFTFEEGVTYTITNAINAPVPGNPSAWRYTYTSADGATKAIITLAYGATQNIACVDPTRIDSSLGQCIFSYIGVITTSFNWSNDLGHGRIIPEAGGESVTVAGITKDNAGTALGSCDVYLFRDNGNDTPTYIAYQESNSVTGAYSFTVFPGSAYFVVAFKGGATPVMDVTDRTVTAV
jgi:hypothetical protein